MQQKGFSTILVGIIVSTVLVVGASGYIFLSWQKQTPLPSTEAGSSQAAEEIQAQGEKEASKPASRSDIVPETVFQPSPQSQPSLQPAATKKPTSTKESPSPSKTTEPPATSATIVTKPLFRQYPDFVKCSWVAYRRLPDISGSLSEIKKLGINTICLMATASRFDDVKLPPDIEKGFQSAVNTTLETIKKSGFALFITVDVPGSSKEVWEELAKLTPTEFLDIADQEALKWAQLAEKYQAEYFAPHNELSSRLDGPPQWFGETEADRLRRISMVNDWHDKILPKVRGVFSGKVVAKLGTPEKGVLAKGYDYTGLTVGHGLVTNVNEFREKVKIDYQIATDIARESQSSWMITEIYLAYEEPSGGGDISAEYEKRKEILKDLQDNYFAASIKEFQPLPPALQPKGYMPVGFGPGTFSTLTQDAVKVIQDFFLEVRPTS